MEGRSQGMQGISASWEWQQASKPRPQVYNSVALNSAPASSEAPYTLKRHKEHSLIDNLILAQWDLYWTFDTKKTVT